MMKKGIEWLKEAIGELDLVDTVFEADGVSYIDTAVSVMQVYDLIDQLDEQEVLSRKWIEEHTYYEDEYDFYYADPDELKNLLVPKQKELESKIKVLIEAYKQEDGAYSNPENGWISGFVEDLENLVEEEPEVLSHELPVVPKYVADWLVSHREKYDLYPALKRLEGNPFGWDRIYEWYRTNTHKFVNAYLTGEYEVEEKPLYYALIKGHELLADHDALSFTYWNFNMSNGYLLHGNKFSKQVRFLTKMTKEDWNKLGINDSNADFVRVDNNQDNYLTNKDNITGGNT